MEKGGWHLGVIVDEVQFHVGQEAGAVVDLVHGILQRSGYGSALHVGKFTYLVLSIHLWGTYVLFVYSLERRSQISSANF